MKTKLIFLVLGTCFYANMIFATTEHIVKYEIGNVELLELSINGECADSVLGRGIPHIEISSDKLFNLCIPNINNCNVAIYVATRSATCSGPEIGSVTIDTYNGVSSVQIEQPGKYNINYGIASPQIEYIGINKIN